MFDLKASGCYCSPIAQLGGRHCLVIFSTTCSSPTDVISTERRMARGHEHNSARAR